MVHATATLATPVPTAPPAPALTSALVMGNVYPTSSASALPASPGTTAHYVFAQPTAPITVSAITVHVSVTTDLPDRTAQSAHAPTTVTARARVSTICVNATLDSKVMTALY